MTRQLIEDSVTRGDTESTDCCAMTQTNVVKVPGEDSPLWQYTWTHDGAFVLDHADPLFAPPAPLLSPCPSPGPNLECRKRKSDCLEAQCEPKRLKRCGAPSSLCDLREFLLKWAAPEVPSLLCACAPAMMERVPGLTSSASMPASVTSPKLAASKQTSLADLSFLLSTKKPPRRTSSNASTVQLESPPDSEPTSPEVFTAPAERPSRLRRTDTLDHDWLDLPSHVTSDDRKQQAPKGSGKSRQEGDSDDDTSSTPDIMDVLALRLSEVEDSILSPSREQPMEVDAPLPRKRKLKVTFSPSTRGYDSFTGEYSKKHNSGARPKRTKQQQCRQQVIQRTIVRANTELGVEPQGSTDISGTTVQPLPSDTQPTPMEITTMENPAARGLAVSGRRAFREATPECNFLLQHLPWTSWQKVMTPAPASCTKTPQWVPRGSDLGIRKRILASPAERCTQPALYEFAIQPPSSSRRVVTYVAASQGLLNPSKWDEYLIHTNLIKAAADDVIQKGCSIWCRMANLNSDSTVIVGNATVTGPFAVKRALLHKYNYAWNGRHKRCIV